MNFHKYGRLVFVVLCCCAAGCSNGNVAVRGLAAYEDGTPLDGGMILFESETGTGRGNIDKNGYYVAGYVKDRDGLPPGTYKAAVPVTSFEGARVAGNQTMAQTTDVTITVERGKKNYDIVFQKPGGSTGRPDRPPRP